MDTRTSLATIVRSETVGRRIEKIIDAIALMAVQTSMLAVSGSVEAATSSFSIMPTVYMAELCMPSRKSERQINGLVVKLLERQSSPLL